MNILRECFFGDSSILGDIVIKQVKEFKEMLNGRYVAIIVKQVFISFICIILDLNILKTFIIVIINGAFNRRTNLMTNLMLRQPYLKRWMRDNKYKGLKLAMILEELKFSLQP